MYKIIVLGMYSLQEHTMSQYGEALARMESVQVDPEVMAVYMYDNTGRYMFHWNRP
jgi:hypothetical protein